MCESENDLSQRPSGKGLGSLEQGGKSLHEEVKTAETLFISSLSSSSKINLKSAFCHFITWREETSCLGQVMIYWET